MSSANCEAGRDAPRCMLLAHLRVSESPECPWQAIARTQGQSARTLAICPTRQSVVGGVEQALSRVALVVARKSERVIAPLEVSVVGVQGEPRSAAG
jgi:hypothetical protein